MILGVVALMAFVTAVGIAISSPRLDVIRQLEPNRITVGETAEVNLRLRNASRWRPITAGAIDVCGSQRISVPLAQLRPGQETTATYDVPGHKRGVFDTGPLTVARRDLFGLASSGGRYGHTERLWVHPRLRRLRRTPDGLARSLEGATDKIEQGSLTFHALREYVIGDELRHVHWRTSARIGQLMVKEHIDTSLPTIVIALDNRPQAWDFASFEAACEAAYSVLVASFRAEYHVSFATACHKHIGGIGAADYGDALAQVEPDAETRQADFISRVQTHFSGDTLVWICGAKEDLPAAQLARLRRKYPELVAVRIGKGLSASATVTSGIPVVQAATGEDFATAWDRGGNA
ncbi:DUF58 domain-containing protein [Natronoglycomyces albus]|uniref:DUF58 domain-containing protein n=1 Tax=Natronoglycomyces albus TaxID=2811108 RepID=A0A895XN74_9ACTN|nr:DUF58 domain-containing protein [Natronoglycomyces albus]QSB04495.1 DUF58 domain-containing protein [Natronoglycomyces albus]